jgi:hypothetical protein
VPCDAEQGPHSRPGAGRRRRFGGPPVARSEDCRTTSGCMARPVRRILEIRCPKPLTGPRMIEPSLSGRQKTEAPPSGLIFESVHESVHEPGPCGGQRCQACQPAWQYFRWLKGQSVYLSAFARQGLGVRFPSSPQMDEGPVLWGPHPFVGSLLAGNREEVPARAPTGPVVSTKEMTPGCSPGFRRPGTVPVVLC